MTDLNSPPDNLSPFQLFSAAVNPLSRNVFVSHNQVTLVKLQCYLSPHSLHPSLFLVSSKQDNMLHFYKLCLFSYFLLIDQFYSIKVHNNTDDGDIRNKKVFRFGQCKMDIHQEVFNGPLKTSTQYI